METRPEFDYSKLRGRIIEKFGTLKAFARAMKMSSASLTNKLTGLTYFSQADIVKSVDLLEIEPGAVSLYFFALKVKKT
jgi:hypothetical protein